MTYFHSFWCRPQASDPFGKGETVLALPDYEALTWLVSALEAGRHGSMRLITDQRGLQFIRNVGLESVYPGGISMELEEIPAEIDPQVFWAAGKLFAWQSLSEAAVSLDPDAICWEPVTFDAPVVALHTEDLDCADYAFQNGRYARFGFSGPEWSWNDPAVNCAVLSLNDPELRQAYAGEAIRFMRDFSRALREASDTGNGTVEPWSDAMLFAEQRLLSIMMRRLGRSGVSLAHFDPRRRHLAANPRCLHLWGTKRFYERCREARAAYVNFLIRHVHESFPDAVPILQRWRMDRPIPVDSLPPDPPHPFPIDDPLDAYFRIGRLHGTLQIQDANLPAVRRAYEGATVGYAETLCPEPGTTFELIEVRHEHRPTLSAKPSQSYAPQIKV